MELIKPGSKIPFTRYRKIAVILSTMVNLVVLIMLFVKGTQSGVDFAGGTVVQLKFQQQVTSRTFAERSRALTWAAARSRISVGKGIQ